jgi:hypothetical protein
MNAKTIARDPQSFINALEEKSDKLHLLSPYMIYLMKKMERTTVIKKLMTDRKNIKLQYSNKYKLSKISREQYFAKVKEI